MARIEFEGVSKVFPDGTKAVDDLTLDIPDGGFTVLVGPSGSGKSTAVRMVESKTYAAEQASAHTITATRPGLAFAQFAVALRALRPALQPMLTTNAISGARRCAPTTAGLPAAAASRADLPQSMRRSTL